MGIAMQAIKTLAVTFFACAALMSVSVCLAETPVLDTLDEHDLGPLGLEADRIAPFSKAGVKAAHIRRYGNLIRQTHPASCAAAALANYLTYGLKKPAGENELMAAIGKDGSTKMTAGDIKRMAAAKGVELDAFELTLTELSKPGRTPGIIRIRDPEVIESTAMNKEARFHFVMVDRIVNGRFYVKDPSNGNFELSEAEFVRIWQIGLNPPRGHLITASN
jgi:predicted double-glycine peptidase